MVNFGPAPMEFAVECLSCFAWGSQGGGDHEEEAQGPSSTQQNGADHSPTDPSKVSPLPHWARRLRRGFSLDRLSQKDLGDIELEVGDGEPPETNYGGHTYLPIHPD